MGDEPVDMKFCTNCKKDISAANFTMHEVHCKRHIVLCDQCKEPVPRSDMDEHYDDFHAKVSCSQCSQEVEKPKLDDHMKNTCSKKPENCPYCELELPQSDLTSHQDYCGTRTEACVKCAQFIMMKDQLQHEASNCEYPKPKPSTNGLTSDLGQERDVDFPGLRYEFSDSGFVNPFAMDELSRMLDETRVPETLNSRADIPGFGKRGVPVAGGQPRAYTNNNTTRTRKSTTNRKSELNRQRQRVAEPDPPENVDVDADADHLLALRLQQEDDQDLDSIIRQIEKQSVSQQPPPSPDADGPANLNTYPDDDELIPCEFCGEPFPMDILVQHQSGCDPLATGNWNDDTSWRGERNNEVQGNARGRGVSIPVINNLETDWTNAREIPIQREWESPPLTPPPSQDDFLGDDGQVILPCEFCDEVFPFELLIQHQSICELNPSMTPRVQTPAEPSRRKPSSRRHNVLAVAAQEAYETSLRSHRHQGFPTLVADDDSGDEIIDHMNDVQRITGASNGERNPRKSTNHGNSSRSVASKYGAPVDRFDDYLTRGTRSRARDYAGGHVADSRRGSGRREESRRGSDAQTRSTLDNLLNVDTEHDLLGSVGNSKKKSAKNEDNYVKRGSHPSTGSKKNMPSTGTSARSVMQELNRTQNTTQSQNSRRRAKGNASNNNDTSHPPFDIRPVGSRHQRSTNVFNSDARSRTNNSRSRTKPPGLRRLDDDDND